ADTGADVVDQLVGVHQPLGQARGAAAAEDLGQYAQLVGFHRAGRCHVPGAVDARLRHPVLHHLAGGGGALGDIDRRLGHVRTGGDVTEIAGDLGLGGRHVDVAGQHQHRVVGAVPGAEPVLDV